MESQPALPPPVSPAYASLGRRFGAWALDLTIAFSLVLAAGATMRILHFAGLWAGVEEVPLEQVFARLGIGAKLSIFFAYVLSGGAISSVLFEASAWQATVGKRLLNIYVTDNNGQRITLARSFDRWFVKWFAGFFGGSLVSIITILTTEDHRALHDLAVGTVVLRGRPSLAGKLELWRVLAAFIIPFAWMIGTFLATL